MGLINQLPLYIVRAVTLLIAFAVHEYSHARAAYALGDNTAANAGRMTLNPLVHIDPYGAFMLLLVGFGWAKPVPVRSDIVNRGHKSGMAIVSAAGPLSNFLLALVAALLIRLNIPYLNSGWGAFFFRQFALINISLGVFNLIPIAPLDGEKIVGAYIPDRIRGPWTRIQAYGPQLLQILLLALPYLRVDLFSRTIGPIIGFIYRLFTGA